MVTGSDAPGYLNGGYPRSLSAFGQPTFLASSGGWLLERPISHGGADAMGCYPLFCCQDWTRLATDLDGLADDRTLASVALVTDPFGNWQLGDLERCFPDRLIAFKDHFIIDLTEASPVTLSKHHRYYARRALRTLTIETASDPVLFTDEWTALYATLSTRHGLSGLRAFSRDAFAQQLALPGTVLLLARENGDVVGGQIWYVQGEVAYSHLAAVSERGYELMAAYALYWNAMEVFAGRARYLDLGAGAGVSTAGEEDGLARFKRGWATGTRPTYFGGRILNPELYAAATMAHHGADGAYFPAYREGEFNRSRVSQE